MEEGKQAGRLLIRREKRTGPRTDPCGSPRRTLKERLCDFEKPHKRAYQKVNIESNEQSKKGGQPKSVYGKGWDARQSQKLWRNQY